MQSIVLIGPPGAGKSTVAKCLSKMLGMPVIDTDKMIEEETGRQIGEIFLTNGEAFFRNIERETVLKALGQDESIIALGGGSVLDPEVESRLKDCQKIIYLNVSISNAAPRVGFNKERPLLIGNPRQQWLALMEKRRPIYERIATHIVSTDNKKPQEVAQEIAKELVS
jgi:shikimate kinase